PILVDRPGAGACAAGSAPTAVVLQAAIDLVVAARIDGDVVELADGGLVQVVPVGAAVVAEVGAAVDADEHVHAVLGVDPEGVSVGVDAAAEAHAAAFAAATLAAELAALAAGAFAEIVAAAKVARERLAAVIRAILRHAEDVEVLVVAGIDADLAEVHGSRVDGVDAGPAFAGVGGHEQSAGLIAVGPLLFLGVFFLSAQAGAIRPACGGAAADAGRAAHHQHHVL